MRGVLLAGLTALFLLTAAPIVAFADYGTPMGWNIDIVSYTRGPDYVSVTVKPPAGTVEINVYDYTGTTAQTAYYEQQQGSPTNPITLDSSGDYTFHLWNLQGGGYPTYIRMTSVDSSGTESPSPVTTESFWILQLDVAVWIDGVSSSVLSELQNAVDGLESATGIPQVVQQGQALQNAMTNMGGYSNFAGNDLAFTIPLYPSETVANKTFAAGTVTLFTASQLSQYTWLSVARTVIQALMWVTFVVFLLVRFAPMFKV